VPNINAIIQGLLTISDVTQSPAPYIIPSLDFGNPTLAGTKVYVDLFFQVQTTPTTVPIGGGGGGAEAFLILVINRDPVNNLEVSVVSTGGTGQVVGVFGPGGVCLLFDPTETGLGWTQLTLMAFTATVPATIVTAI
jgi:hypothetical protein